MIDKKENERGNWILAAVRDHLLGLRPTGTEEGTGAAATLFKHCFRLQTNVSASAGDSRLAALVPFKNTALHHLLPSCSFHQNNSFVSNFSISTAPSQRYTLECIKHDHGQLFSRALLSSLQHEIMIRQYPQFVFIPSCLY